MRPKKRETNAGPQKALPNVVIATGCTDFELSYEGKNYGVLSGAILANYKPKQTIRELGRLVGNDVAGSGYPQTPQLVCSQAALKWQVPELDADAGN